MLHCRQWRVSNCVFGAEGTAQASLQLFVKVKAKTAACYGPKQQNYSLDNNN